MAEVIWYIVHYGVSSPSRYGDISQYYIKWCNFLHQECRLHADTVAGRMLENVRR